MLSLAVKVLKVLQVSQWLPLSLLKGFILRLGIAKTFSETATFHHRLNPGVLCLALEFARRLRMQCAWLQVHVLVRFLGGQTKASVNQVGIVALSHWLASSAKRRRLKHVGPCALDFPCRLAVPICPYSINQYERFLP